MSLLNHSESLQWPYAEDDFTNNLIRRFGDKVSLVHHDNYYRAHDDLTYDERALLNYDEPEAFETEMMVEHLRLLRQAPGTDTFGRTEGIRR